MHHMQMVGLIIRDKVYNVTQYKTPNLIKSVVTHLKMCLSTATHCFKWVDMTSLIRGTIESNTTIWWDYRAEHAKDEKCVQIVLLSNSKTQNSLLRTQIGIVLIFGCLSVHVGLYRTMFSKQSCYSSVLKYLRQNGKYLKRCKICILTVYSKDT